MRRRMVLVLIPVVALAACADMGQKETAGTVVGGASGAVIGSQFGRGSGRLVGAAIGTLAGALVGQQIGKSLDEADRRAMQDSAQNALEYSETHHPTTWRNPDTGNHGSVTPVRTYRGLEGRYCREYRQTVVIGGEEQRAYGRACRQPDGAWKIVR